MTPIRVFAAAGLAVLLAACGRDTDGTFQPQDTIGSLRYLHASPDTRAADFRVIDYVSNANLFATAYRGTAAFPTAVRVGNRSIRAFVSSSNVDSAQVILMETSLSVAQGTSYTLAMTGLRTGNQLQPLVVENTPPAPGAGNFTLRIVNVGHGMGAVDAVAIDDEDNEVTVASGLAVNGIGSWVNVPTGAVTVEVREAGTATVLATATVPAGVAATATQTAVPGSTIAGSGLTGYVMAPSIAEPGVPTFANPGVVFVYDRRPD